MTKEYELWLDESGNFENEKSNSKDKEQFPHGFQPSLIGGWLVDYNRCHHDDLSEFVIANPVGEQYHVAGMDKDEGKKLQLSGIRTVHEKYGGRMVIFQNKELKDYGNRELYLRLMGAGLLQLVQELNAENESVKLHVIIARRMDMTKEAKHQEIIDKEYQEILEKYIHSKKIEKRISLHEDTEMSITIDSARKDNRLKLADYVCNTQLTFDSGKYTDEEKKEFFTLKKDGYEYSFYENSTENVVKMYLAQGDVANALVETVMNSRKESFMEMLELIGEKMSVQGYRGNKVQLAQCTKEFTTLAYSEDDYERGEEWLKQLLQVVVPFMEKRGFPCDKFKFTMELHLTDMYLREGDIDAATAEMVKCREADKALSSSLENVLFHYQLMEKEALLYIDSFEFDKGAELMSKACAGFKAFLDGISKVEAVSERYPELISEYYGDALCMKIYAELFLQRKMPEIYSSLAADSDVALKQYGPYEGELERHRQYRSIIEMQKGNYGTAAKWLLMTQKSGNTMISLTDGSALTKQEFVMFLKSVIQREWKTSRRYYLMYYVKIMAEAALAGDEIADEMANALKNCPDIQETEDMNDWSGRTDHGTKTSEKVLKELAYVLRRSKYVDYHPIEGN